MKLEIGPETKIEDVQKRFSAEYPYLKIDFYKRQHAENELSPEEDMISPDKRFREIEYFSKPGSVEMDKHRTVGDFESAFYEKFGIAMQVSRKSGNIWIQTSRTDDRTLEMQNQSGESMSKR